jgi:tRNA 2-thiouridine synthesizing protein A
VSENPETGLPEPDEVLDVSGHECPVPAAEARRRLDAMAPGQVLEVIATDPLAAVDLQILCDRCGHALLGRRDSAGVLTVWIRVSPGHRPGAG